MIEKITCSQPDTELIDTVLLTIYSFTTPLQFFKLLIQRYHGPKNNHTLVNQEEQTNEYLENKKNIHQRISYIMERWFLLTDDFFKPEMFQAITEHNTKLTWGEKGTFKDFMEDIAKMKTLEKKKGTFMET